MEQIVLKPPLFVDRCEESERTWTTFEHCL